MYESVTYLDQRRSVAKTAHVHVPHSALLEILSHTHVFVSACMTVCVCHRERKREKIVGVGVCVCVCDRERDRERGEYICVIFMLKRHTRS